VKPGNCVDDHVDAGLAVGVAGVDMRLVGVAVTELG
jgi:hypothetical protein